MIIVEQPNLWSCLPAAFATATGIPFDTLIENIGHDGSDVVFPDLPEPLCRRGFHCQELSRVLLRFGFCVASFESCPIGYLDEEHSYDVTEDLLPIMVDSIGVLCGRVRSTGKLHSVAWDGKKCYDPSGFCHDLSYYEIEIYYRLGRA